MGKSLPWAIDYQHDRTKRMEVDTSAMETRTVHDPFTGQDVQISDRLVDRLRGKYASGPHLPNGRPEFGWRQFEAPPIQHEAAARIEELEAALTDCWEIAGSDCRNELCKAIIERASPFVRERG